MALKSETFQPVKRGPNTPEARAKASEDGRKSWEIDRSRHLQSANAGKPENSVRRLRLALPGPDGKPGMSQPAFAEAIGLSGKNAQRISQLENGLRPTPQNIAAMQRLAEEHGIAWKYE